MKIAVLHGQSHKGSTYNITQLFINKIKDIDAEVNEFYFMKNDACIGCFQCFMKGEEQCPHYTQVSPIISAIQESDLVIIESPCYCMGMAGQLKIFLDHMGYRWMAHRPHSKMFRKVGLTISTAAGAGAKKVTKDMAQHMFHWGIPIIFKYGVNVGASSWEEVSEKKRLAIEKDVDRIADKVHKKIGKAKSSFKTKGMFSIMRMSQKSNNWNETDKKYWEKNGWLEKQRPWYNL